MAPCVLQVAKPCCVIVGKPAPDSFQNFSVLGKPDYTGIILLEVTEQNKTQNNKSQVLCSPSTSYTPGCMLRPGMCWVWGCRRSSRG